jgi:hypothetical protein
MGRERVTEVFRSAGSGGSIGLPGLHDLRRLAELLRVPVLVVPVIHRSHRPLLRSSLLELEREQRGPEPPRHGNGHSLPDRSAPSLSLVRLCRSPQIRSLASRKRLARDPLATTQYLKVRVALLEYSILVYQRHEASPSGAGEGATAPSPVNALLFTDVAYGAPFRLSLNLIFPSVTPKPGESTVT